MKSLLLQSAAIFARDAHKGQVRDDGTPFISHPIIVARIITLLAPDDENLIAAALMHDVIEDTDFTYADLLGQFGPDIANLVHEVTHEGQQDSKGFYFPRLHTQRGIMLKFADRLSNLSDMDTWDEKRKQHYLSKSKFWRSE
jgi:(p)ppGpp synthase/HD superfamily hydrolase